MKLVPSLELGDYRLLEVDYRAIVPTAIDAILVVTSDDLLHSFTIPTYRLNNSYSHYIYLRLIIVLLYLLP